MSSELTPMQSFTERLQSKIRDDIAGMLPDDVINEMVKRATNELFFKREKENRGSNYSPNYVETPSMFEKMVNEAVEPLLKQRINAVIAEKMPEIEAAMQAALEKGMLATSLSVLDNVFRDAIMKSGWTITQALQNQGIR